MSIKMDECVGSRKSLVERNTGSYCKQQCVQSTGGPIQQPKLWKPKFENPELCRDWSKKKAVPKTPAEWACQQYKVPTSAPTESLQALDVSKSSMNSLGGRRSLVERNTGPYSKQQRVQSTGRTIQQSKLWKPKFENPKLCRDWSKKKAVPKTPSEWASLQYQEPTSYVRPKPQQRSGSQPPSDGIHVRIEELQSQIERLRKLTNGCRMSLKAQYQAACQRSGGIPTPSALLQSQYDAGRQLTKLQVPRSYNR